MWCNSITKSLSSSLYFPWGDKICWVQSRQTDTLFSEIHYSSGLQIQGWRERENVYISCYNIIGTVGSPTDVYEVYEGIDSWREKFLFTMASDSVAIGLWGELLYHSRKEESYCYYRKGMCRFIFILARNRCIIVLYIV